ncbi:MAG TPA: hypothetical protein VHS56_02540 [Candidatus Cybelea sp.]|jgi:hypothetical protein|nr:hypothetical protein [Candidatus Cybelea sp.]
MFDLADSLRDAMAQGHRQLLDAQRSLAQANAGLVPGRRADAAMAQTARAAIFSEALLTAAHARFEEIKVVTK